MYMNQLNCPYNSAHIMPKQSFLNHLRKCQATNKNQFAQCEYDLFHVVRKQTLQKHYFECKAAQEKNKKKTENAFDDDDDWNQYQPEIKISNFSDDNKVFQDQEQKNKRKGRSYVNAAPPNINKYDKIIEDQSDWNPKIPQKKEQKNKKSSKTNTKKQPTFYDLQPFDCNVSMIENANEPSQSKKNKNKQQPTLKKSKNNEKVDYQVSDF